MFGHLTLLERCISFPNRQVIQRSFNFFLFFWSVWESNDHKLGDTTLPLLTESGALSCSTLPLKLQTTCTNVKFRQFKIRAGFLYYQNMNAKT